MTDKLIQAPISVWGATTTGQAEQKLVECFNNTSGTLQHGDVVVVDTSAGQMPAAPGTITGAVVTSTTAADPTVLGVVSITGTADTSAATVAKGAVCQVCIGGIARVQVGSNTVTAGSHGVVQSTTAKQGNGVAYASIVVGSMFAIPLESSSAKDANNTIRCIIKSA